MLWMMTHEHGVTVVYKNNNICNFLHKSSNLNSQNQFGSIGLTLSWQASGNWWLLRERHSFFLVNLNSSKLSMSHWLAPWLFTHRQHELDWVSYIRKHNMATYDIRLTIHGLTIPVTVGGRTGKNQTNL